MFVYSTPPKTSPYHSFLISVERRCHFSGIVDREKGRIEDGMSFFLPVEHICYLIGFYEWLGGGNCTGVALNADASCGRADLDLTLITVNF